MLMGYPSVQEASSFQKFLDQFGNASGLEVNVQKSQVFFFNTPSITRRNIIRILGETVQQSFTCEQFLGIEI